LKVESLVLSGPIFIGPAPQKFLGIVTGDQNPWIIERKIADNKILINSQPFSGLIKRKPACN
jgi:hypothetical protein